MTNARANHTTSAASEAVPARQLDAMDRDRLRRYREYLEWYEGKRGAPPARGRDRVLNFNYARAVVEKGAAYLVTEHRPTVTATAGDVDARRPESAAPRAPGRARAPHDAGRPDPRRGGDTPRRGRRAARPRPP